MPKIKHVDNSEPRIIAPSVTPEGEEDQNIALAVGLANKQLREGTASAQVISHYLKLATEKERTEVEILKLQRELVKAKTDSIVSVQRSEEAAEKALQAFRRYSGNNVVEDDEDYVIYE